MSEAYSPHVEIAGIYRTVIEIHEERYYLEAERILLKRISKK
jgi:hypothetical protein